ncbi:hypothetical protein LINGRAHAP2_LOCUS21892 [Linum grandiflorum]
MKPDDDEASKSSKEIFDFLDDLFHLGSLDDKKKVVIEEIPITERTKNQKKKAKKKASKARKKKQSPLEAAAASSLSRIAKNRKTREKRKAKKIALEANVARFIKFFDDEDCCSSREIDEVSPISSSSPLSKTTKNRKKKAKRKAKKAFLDSLEAAAMFRGHCERCATMKDDFVKDCSSSSEIDEKEYIFSMKDELVEEITDCSSSSEIDELEYVHVELESDIYDYNCDGMLVSSQLEDLLSSQGFDEP